MTLQQRNHRLQIESVYCRALAEAIARHATVEVPNLELIEDYKFLIAETTKRIDKLLKESPQG